MEQKKIKAEEEKNLREQKAAEEKIVREKAEKERYLIENHHKIINEYFLKIKDKNLFNMIGQVKKRIKV